MELQTSTTSEPAVVTENSALYRITPLSKYLAMALFILLPFIGGYVGYTLAPIKIIQTEVAPSITPATEVASGALEVGLVDQNVASKPSTTDTTVQNEPQMSKELQEFWAQYTKYPKYEVRTVPYADSTGEALIGIDATGEERQVSYVLPFSKPTKGDWVYYARYRPDSDAGQGLAFAYNSLTNELRMLTTARQYQDTWTVEEKRISPDGLRFVSAHLWGLDKEEQHSLYVVDLASDSARTVKVLPENETFVLGKDAFGGMPVSEVSWIDNSTIEAKVYDSTRTENDPLTGMEVHPYLRSERISL